MHFSFSLDEDICAVATSSAHSGLHVIRICGPHVFEKCNFALISVKTKTRFELNKILQLKAPLCAYAWLNNKRGEQIDDVVVIFYKGPKSYSGEDTIEICCHGNPLISAEIMQLLSELNIREAMPGEFTHRAYLNGKMDLVQAEAVALLVSSSTKQGIHLARHTQEGSLAKSTQNVRASLISGLALLEALIDFSEDEIGILPKTKLLEPLENAKKELIVLHNSFVVGRRALTGVKVVLCGEPNAGKSSLFNALLGEDKAIVTQVAGTTRDVLDSAFRIRDKDFVLLDTAGLRKSFDEVEQIGIERAKTQIFSADVILLLVPCNSRETLGSLREKELCAVSEIEAFRNKEQQKFAVLYSKSDLLPQELKTVLIHEPRGAEVRLLVSKDDDSDCVAFLTKAHEELTFAGREPNQPVLISERQKHKVANAIQCVSAAMLQIENEEYPEIIASSVTGALKCLGEILGEVDLDEVYGEIFSKFCIGK